MKEVCLVRHGDTDATEREYFAGWMNLPLTPTGAKEDSEGPGVSGKTAIRWGLLESPCPND